MSEGKRLFNDMQNTQHVSVLYQPHTGLKLHAFEHSKRFLVSKSYQPAIVEHS